MGNFGTNAYGYGIDPDSHEQPFRVDRKGRICIASDDEAFTKRYTYSSDNPEYIGWAEPGAATSAASWRIGKWTYDTSDNITGQQWADGNTKFDNVWDNRATYTYT